MKIILSHLYIQFRPAFPSEHPYHFEIIEQPETLEEYQAARNDGKRVIDAATAFEMGITLPDALEAFNVEALATHERTQAELVAARVKIAELTQERNLAIDSAEVLANAVTRMRAAAAKVAEAENEQALNAAIAPFTKVAD